MESAENYRIVFVTLDREEIATSIARLVVAEGLAACCSIVPGLRSVYNWKGTIEEAQEQMLIIKTSAPLLAKLEKRIRELHNYEVPEIIAIKLEEAHQPYLQWLDSVLVTTN